MLNLGVSVVIFLVIGVVVMALFCLVTRYFNKKLEKAMDDENEVYSMIEEIKGKGENQDEGQNEYENYVNKRQNDAMKKENQPFQLEMTEVKEPLKGYDHQIYGNGRLKRRLQGESIPLNPETGRSISSLKSFKPDRLDSMRKGNPQNALSNRSNQSDDAQLIDNNSPDSLSKRPPRQKKDKKKDIVYHKYISKIVCYIEQGIFIIENNLISITKGQQVSEKRNTKNSVIKPDQNSFNNTLEAYGFQKGTYCAYKFESTLQIPHMKQNEEYPVGSLKVTQSKSEIQFPEFYNIKDQLEEN